MAAHLDYGLSAGLFMFTVTGDLHVTENSYYLVQSA